MGSTVAVIRFPGTNCEFDMAEAVAVLDGDPRIVFHDETSLGSVDSVVIAGGFAHGDYLRPGAIARFSPIMEAVSRFALDGGAVIGICNGFQVLCESQLLPGALQKNAGLRFRCGTARLRVESATSALTNQCAVGDELNIPINHFEGNYTCSDSTLAELRSEDRVVLRYLDNPNGSVDEIAGICNEGRNVVGLMPHPERACNDLLGSSDGEPLIRSVLQSALLST